ncbi:MAG: hypothetical protein KDK39_04895, partial [Leptospiraceae bacterium]|nr:hypothetical protein [Leptospiraceae bacterium]
MANPGRDNKNSSISGARPLLSPVLIPINRPRTLQKLPKGDVLARFPLGSKSVLEPESPVARKREQIFTAELTVVTRDVLKKRVTPATEKPVRREETLPGNRADTGSLESQNTNRRAESTEASQPVRIDALEIELDPEIEAELGQIASQDLPDLVIEDFQPRYNASKPEPVAA